MFWNFRLLFVILWVATILIATCTTDARAFLFDQIISYNFEPRPAFSELLIVDDINFYDDFYLLQKIGHFTSFGILFFLVLNWLKGWRATFMTCAIFGFFTEILQLYFTRDGRLFDAFIDLSGIFAAFVIYCLIKSLKRIAPSAENS